MDSRTRCSVLISFHRRLRDRDESPSLLPVTTAGVPPMRPGRRRRLLGDRLPTCTYAAFGTTRPATSACPIRTSSRRRRDPGARREQPAEIGQIGFRVHPHEQQVVALGHHVLVHLVRALRRGQQVQPVLAPFRGDLHDRVRGEPTDLVAGIRRADVVRLVDDDQAGLPRMPRPPQRREDGLGDELLLRGRAERPRSTTMHRAVGSRSSATSEGCWGSDGPVEQADVAGPQAERPSSREVGRAS